MFSRRDLIRTASAGAALGALPLEKALAATVTDRKFIFIFNGGGWDPTRVFASEFSNPNVDMERDAAISTRGDLKFVDHPDRPSVTSFFDQYASRTVFFNGVLVPSIAHENCTRLIWTGSSRPTAADWGAIVAGNSGDRYSLPQVVAAGPSYPGDFGVYVTRTGTQGQVPALLSGDIMGWSDVPVAAPGGVASLRMDEVVRARAAARSNQGAFVSALDRASALKAVYGELHWSTTGAFDEQIAFATDLLSKKISRCVTLQSPFGYDTHTNNDEQQSGNFETLFSNVNDLLTSLSAVPGVDGGVTMADETVIVLLSEMGRTPRLNGNQGKDHWPYTCVMACGPGLRGGQVFGGYDLYYYGRKVNPQSGLVDDDAGINLGSDVVGATLVQLAGVDSEEFLAGVGYIEAALDR